MLFEVDSWFLICTDFSISEEKREFNQLPRKEAEGSTRLVSNLRSATRA